MNEFVKRTRDLLENSNHLPLEKVREAEIQRELDVHFSDRGARRYEIREKLGEGSYGVVYKVYDKKMKRYVAVKQVGSLPGQEKIIQREIVAARLDDERIITPLDYGETVVVLEYVENSITLEEKLRGGKLSRGDKLSLMLEIARAVGYLHAKGVQHRDIKLSNIIVHEKKVKIIDFGLALVGEMEREGVSSGINASLYRAPEVKEKRECTCKSDIYSLGIVFLLIALDNNLCEGQVKSLGEGIQAKDLSLVKPKKLRKLIQAMVAREKEQRPCAEEIIKHMENIVKPKAWLVPTSLAASLFLASAMLFFLPAPTPLEDSVVLFDKSQSLPARRNAFVNMVHLQEHKTFRGIDLAGASLSGETLVEIDLSESDFQGCKMAGVVLRSSNLKNGTFIDADLRDAYLRATNLQGTNFSGANLQKATLQNAKFKGADFTDAILDGAHFTFANYLTPEQILAAKSIEGIRGLPRLFLEKVREKKPHLMRWWDGKCTIGEELAGKDLDQNHLTRLDFREVNLQNTMFHSRFYMVNLEKANFQGADLSRMVFDGCNFQDTILKGANLQDASFQGTPLYKVNLEKANFQGADLSRMVFDGCNFQDAILKGANLQDASLQGTPLYKVNLEKANLQGADLSGMVFDGCNFQDTILKGANLQDASFQGTPLSVEQLCECRNIDGIKGIAPAILQEVKKKAPHLIR